jgi:hypothetical protein
MLDLRVFGRGMLESIHETHERADAGDGDAAEQVGCNDRIVHSRGGDARRLSVIRTCTIHHHVQYFRRQAVYRSGVTNELYEGASEVEAKSSRSATGCRVQIFTTFTLVHLLSTFMRSGFRMAYSCQLLHSL